MTEVPIVIDLLDAATDHVEQGDYGRALANMQAAAALLSYEATAGPFEGPDAGAGGDPFGPGGPF